MFQKQGLILAALIGVSCGLNAAASQAGSDFDIQNALQVPGTVLQPGHYTLGVEEDVLKDRTIVRLTNADKSTNLLLLAVPNNEMVGKRNGPIVDWETTGADDQHILRGWQRSGSSISLEFAYPKDEAVKLANDVNLRVLAIDPASQKLPALPSMSKDDLKIIDLWLLSYSRTTPGVKKLSAAKYQPASTPQESASSAEPSGPKVVAAASKPAHTSARLPHTAGNTFQLLAAGLALLASSLLVRALRFGLRSAR